MYYKDGAYVDATDLDYAWYKSHYEMSVSFSDGSYLYYNFKSDATSCDVTDSVNISSISSITLGCFLATYNIDMFWQ